MAEPLIIRADWDDKAQVWVATSADVPGLATEADDLERLSRKLADIVPELLELNRVAAAKAVPFKIVTKRTPV